MSTTCQQVVTRAANWSSANGFLRSCATHGITTGNGGVSSLDLIVSNVSFTDITTYGGNFDGVKSLVMKGCVSRGANGTAWRVVNTVPDVVMVGNVCETAQAVGLAGTITRMMVQGNSFDLRGSATYDPANLVDGAGATTTVGVTGAALGDFAQASFTLDVQGITLTAWVSAANVVSVRFQNETGGALDLASGTLRAIVERRS